MSTCIGCNHQGGLNEGWCTNCNLVRTLAVKHPVRFRIARLRIRVALSVAPWLRRVL